MKFTVQDTIIIYHKIIAEKDQSKKKQIFKYELIKPYEGMFRAMGGSLDPYPGMMDAMNMLQGWAFIMPEHLDDKVLETLLFVEKYDPVKVMTDTLGKANDLLKDHSSKIPLENVHAGFFLNDKNRIDPMMGDYTGFGGIPGYIMINYWKPTGHNMKYLPAALSHEFCHNVQGSLHPWNPAEVTVGSYIIMEGLAESFATSLCGKDRLGFYVADFDMKEMPRVKEILKYALHISDFNNTRKYLYGDAMIKSQGGSGVGIPAYAGYVAGYYIVQEFMKNTGKGIVEAIFTP